MGNASTSGAAGILIVDKPYVPDQDNNEELEVILTVKGEAVRIDTWPDEKGDFSPREPNNTVAVPPPLRGTVLASVWAINADDDEERRLVGQVLVPHTSLESLEESGFTIWLGLLDQVPDGKYPRPEEADSAFNSAVLAAKDPSRPKICFTFATIGYDVVQGTSAQQDVQAFQNQLARKPVMRLLGHANDLIKGLTKNNKALQKELRALHREFRSKETIFHSFVHVEKKTLEENRERILNTLRKEAGRWAKLLGGEAQLEVIFQKWVGIAKDFGLERMKDKLANVNKKTLDLLNASFGKNDKEQEQALLHTVFDIWRVNAKNFKTIEVAIMRMFGFHDPKITVELVFLGWRHVMALEEREHPAKVSVECTLRNIDHTALSDDMDLAGSLTHHLKESLLSEIDKKHGVSAKNIRISLHPDRMLGFMTVMMLIAPSSSWTAGEIKKQLEDKAVKSELGAMVQARLVAVPQIFGICRMGPLVIENVVVKYLRGESEQQHRDRMATHLDSVIEFFVSAERSMWAEILLLSWANLLAKKRREESLCDKMLIIAQRFLRGEAVEFMSAVINQWQAHKDIAKLHGWTSVRLSEEKKKWEGFVDEQVTRQGQELERLQTVVEVEKERAHEHVDSVVKKWIHGEIKGLMYSCFINWRRYMEIQEELQQKHETVKLAVMKWVEGEDKGIKVVCFRHWVHFIMLERVHLINGQRLAEEEAKWKNLMDEQNTRYGEDIERHLSQIEVRKEQAHEVTQMMLKQWSMGNAKGTAASCLYEWRRYIDVMRELERRHEHAKACVMNFVEGEKKSAVHLCFIHWVHYRKLEQEHHKREDIKTDLEHLGELNQKKIEEAEQRHRAAKASIELAVRKWECGNTNAVKMETFSLWHKYTIEQVTFRRGRQAVKVQAMKWLEGENRGLLQATFGSWREDAKVVREARKAENDLGKAREEWDQFMAEEKSIHGKELDRIQTEAEKRREQAHEVTEMMLKRWTLGDTKGTLTTMMYEWKRWVEIQRDLQRRHEAAKAAVMGWVKGADRANKQLCWSHWVAFLEVQRVHREHDAKNSDFDAFLKEIREDHGKELERIMTEAEKRKEQAHEVTEMMIKRWYAGDVKGTVMTCVYEWKRYVSIMKGLERRHEAVKTAVLSFLHDRGKGVMKVCWSHWVAFFEQEKIHRQHGAWKEEMEGFLKEQNLMHGKELDRIMTEKEREKEKAHEVTRMMLTKWLLGETTGLLASLTYEWNRILYIMKDLRRRNEAVKASALGWIEGSNNAAKHLCFTHWVAFRDLERVHLQHGSLRAELDDLKNVHLGLKNAADKARERGRIAVEMSLHKFLEGDRQGSLHSCFLLWEGYANVMKKQRHKDAEITEAHSNHAYNIEKQRLDHELKVAKEKEAKVAALEALGFKNARLTFFHYFELWTIFHVQAKEIRIEKEHKEHLLDKTFLTMGWADADQLKHICLHEWHQMLPNKDLIKAEMANEQWQKLHTGPMRQMLFKMCAYDDAHVLKDVFYVFKEYVDQLRFHHALKQLNTSKKDHHRLEMERALMRMDSSLLSHVAFAEWKKAWLDYSHSKNADMEKARIKRRHGALVTKALELLSLESRMGLITLLQWRGIVKSEKSGRRAEESNEELRKHLAVHCLATSEQATDSLATSDKYASLASLLQGEMHTQGVTLEALEHEVFLLESQMSNMNRRILAA